MNAKLIEDLQIDEAKKVVRVRGLARALIFIYQKIGIYLYERGFLSQVVDADELTGAYNRSFFGQWSKRIYQQALRSGEALSLVYVDLNDLKKLNDTVGHKHGDRLLKKFVNLLYQGTRSSDVIFRVGGDEFVVLMWSCTNEQAETKMTKIQARGEKKDVRFSFGVVEVGLVGGVDKAIKLADEKMYMMKKEMKKSAKTRR
jgi:diguanylate cyclase (GGDEF)-like protein